MKPSIPENTNLRHGLLSRPRVFRLLAIVCAILLLLLWTSRHQELSVGLASKNDWREGGTGNSSQPWQMPPFPRSIRSVPLPEPSAAEIVAAKLAQFAQSRRGFARALAQRHKVEISGDVQRFFDSVESGNWDEIEGAFKKINGGDSSASSGNSNRPPGMEHLWPAIIDAFGAAEQVHEWPAPKLLDYGNGILGSLSPGMVYVGGTDSGRWIPELLNDTSDGERHVVVTQNGLADASYLDYLHLQYDDRLSTLTGEDSKRAFDDYVGDARKRFEHDQQFPAEPKQVLSGEDIKVVDGKVEVGGQPAVMAINEKLLQTLMEKNSGLPFGLQESFPLKGTYADALPLGPLMELRASNAQNNFTSERAAQSLEYWQNTAQQALTDPDKANAPEALKSYSHDAVAAANLLAAHNFTAEAEQAFRLAGQLWPENPEPVGGLADMLARSGRENDARQLLEEFARQHPDQQKYLERISSAFKVIGPTPP